MIDNFMTIFKLIDQKEVSYFKFIIIFVEIGALQDAQRLCPRPQGRKKNTNFGQAYHRRHLASFERESYLTPPVQFQG
jgi:hypothetical protein